MPLMLRIQPPEASTSGKYAPLHSDVELNHLNDTAERVHDNSAKPPSAKPSWISVRLRDLYQGWRFGAFLGFLTCLLVLILNLTLTIWASIRSKHNNGHIYQGSCAATKRYNVSLHIIINILSTLLLGASNYSMQCLSAPTRNVVDQAHQEGKWLDVGVQSLRNLKWSKNWKKAIWALLALSSLPLHLL